MSPASMRRIDGCGGLLWQALYSKVRRGVKIFARTVLMNVFMYAR
jgi:hypothetical protein